MKKYFLLLLALTSFDSFAATKRLRGRIAADDKCLSVKVSGTDTDVACADGATGNLGVGTAAPTEKLEVSGGNFKVSGTSTSAGVILSSTTCGSGKNVCADTFTPTLSNPTNLDSNSAVGGQFIRIGTVVVYSFRITLNPTTGGIVTAIDATVPQTTANFTAKEHAVGTCGNDPNSGGTTLNNWIVFANTSAQTIHIVTTNTQETGSTDLYCHVEYRLN